MNIICKSEHGLTYWYSWFKEYFNYPLILRFSKFIEKFPNKTKTMEIIIYSLSNPALPFKKAAFYPLKHIKKHIKVAKESVFLFFEKVDLV